jgi:hypothetical protein
MLGNMVVAILMAHSTHIFTSTKHRGWAMSPECSSAQFAALCLTGGGKYAVTEALRLD